MLLELNPRQVEISSAWQNLKVLVIGDIMADINLQVSPGSSPPEGAGKLFVQEERRIYPGGAANVAMNAVALGAKVTLLGAVGEDEGGNEILRKLSTHNIYYPWGHYVGRHMDWIETTTKTRVYSEAQMLYRIDRDQSYRLPSEKVFEHVRREPYDLMLLSDYQKGAFSDMKGWSLGGLTTAFRDRNPNGYIGINPKPQLCILPWFLDASFDLVSFNLKEFQCMIGLFHGEFTFDTEHPVARTMQWMLLTNGKDGLSVWKRENCMVMSTLAEAVKNPDVVGAGDATFTAAAMALAIGCRHREIVNIANSAGASKCRKQGTNPAHIVEVLENIEP